MKYRSSTEIIDTILRSLNSGATRTRIMYKAYLSYTQLKEYLSLLESRHLIMYEEGSQTYSITQKGQRFINAYDEIRELVSTTEVSGKEKGNIADNNESGIIDQQKKTVEPNRNGIEK